MFDDENKPDYEKKPSRRISFDDAIKVWAMFRAGEFQHRIAAFFDVNPGRVNEVIKGKRHPGSGNAYPPMI